MPVSVWLLRGNGVATVPVLSKLHKSTRNSWEVIDAAATLTIPADCLADVLVVVGGGGGGQASGVGGGGGGGFMFILAKSPAAKRRIVAELRARSTVSEAAFHDFEIS